MWNVGLLLLVVLALGAAAWLTLRRTTVYQYQHALLFRDGRFVKLLEPGVYWLWKLSARVDVLDARPRVLTIPGQEVLSSDSVPLKISLLVRFRVEDPKVAQLEFEDYLQALYAHAQTVLRRLVGETPIEKILENRARLDEALDREVKTLATDLGLEVASVTIKDIMFPGALKDAFSQVVRARQQGLASLERARGESAALRKLANTAKQLENNPQLYKLRLLQSVDGAGSVIVQLGADPGDVIPAGQEQG